MGRSYTFTCHTCRTVYNIGYGSYNGTISPRWGETLEQYSERSKESTLANTRRFEEVMKEHFAHEWDDLDSEFDEDGSFERMRQGYTEVDLQKRDEDKDSAERALMWKAAEEYVHGFDPHGEQKPNARDLARLIIERHPEMELEEDDTAEWLAAMDWIGHIRAKQIGLPKELKEKLQRWEARQRAAAPLQKETQQ